MGSDNSKITYDENGYAYIGSIKFLNNSEWVEHGQGKKDWYDKNDDGSYNDIPNTYIGNFKDGVAEGHGVCIYADDSKYEGNWMSNMRHGKGKMIYTDGSAYDGDFCYDVKHGYGKFTYSTSCYYKGQFESGYISGKGTLYRPNNTVIYKGEWLCGNYHGYGKSYFENGNVEYDGHWIDNLPHGKGILYDNKKNIIENGYFNAGFCYEKISDAPSKKKSKISLSLNKNLFKNNKVTTVIDVSKKPQIKIAFSDTTLSASDTTLKVSDTNSTKPSKNKVSFAPNRTSTFLKTNTVSTNPLLLTSRQSSGTTSSGTTSSGTTTFNVTPSETINPIHKIVSVS